MAISARFRALLADALREKDVARLLAAQERQADALERLVQLGEMALGVDAVSLALQADTAKAKALLDAEGPPEGTVQVDPYDEAAHLAFEASIAALAATLGRTPTDEEIDEELQRTQAAEEAALIAAEQAGQARTFPFGTSPHH